MSRISKLSLNRQLEILSLSKGTFYYEPKGESDENLELMKVIDRIHTMNPVRDVMGMVLDLVALYTSILPRLSRSCVTDAAAS